MRSIADSVSSAAEMRPRGDVACERCSGSVRERSRHGTSVQVGHGKSSAARESKRGVTPALSRQCRSTIVARSGANGWRSRPPISTANTAIATVSVRMICARAQLTERYFYEAFASSEEILVVSAQTLAERTLARMRHLRDTTPRRRRRKDAADARGLLSSATRRAVEGARVHARIPPASRRQPMPNSSASWRCLPS